MVVSFLIVTDGLLVFFFFFYILCTCVVFIASFSDDKYRGNQGYF